MLLTALFFNAEPAAVVLLEADAATRLPQQRSASGARYGDGQQEFWVKGQQARWSRPGMAVYACGPRSGS